MDDELLLESLPDISNELALNSLPESAQNETHLPSLTPETAESLTQATGQLIDAALDQSEPWSATAADSIHGLAQALTDQLQKHHGCCRQCGQQEHEHEIQHADHLGLGEYMDQVQADGGYLGVLSMATMANVRTTWQGGLVPSERVRFILESIQLHPTLVPSTSALLPTTSRNARPR